MSEPRKNHLNIDGGQVKEDDHVATYKPIPDAETEFRSSKSNLSKSKEKVSLDGAEEKLLPKAEEAKIVTRVDMADAHYVVGDHRNGDAKIELDANKRQFSGLTKEELLKYADDPFWVKLRWFLFVLFWALWLGMLAGAIIIIVQAPKCAPPAPKTWFEKGPLVDMEGASPQEIEESLPLLKSSLVQGVFVDAPTYEALDDKGIVDGFRALIAKAKEHGIKVIVDLIPGYVSTDYKWFGLSENRTGDYSSYFVWRKGDGFNDDIPPLPNLPNNWVSTNNTAAWKYSARRGEYYLQHGGAGQPDLDFDNPAVVAHFDTVLDLWINAGAAGVRLQKARFLFVNSSMENENIESARGASLSADHTSYDFWQHQHTIDRPQLHALLARWAQRVNDTAAAAGLGEWVFTMEEEARHRPELFLKWNVTSLRPPAAAPLGVSEAVDALADNINRRLEHWPLMQLSAPLESEEMGREVAAFAQLLPAAPVLRAQQLEPAGNGSERQALAHVAELRDNEILQHGEYIVAPVRATNETEYKLIACARWKEGHGGYVAVLNPSAGPLRANLTALRSLPRALSLYHASHAARQLYNFSSSMEADDVPVPARSTVVLNYVPQTAAES